jgi:hypothetical protein
MADQFRIIPPPVVAAGTDVPPEVIASGFNSLANQTTVALNTLAASGGSPSGPAGGDLSGTYPNPSVAAVHATSGTMSGVAVTGGTIDNTPIGSTTPNTVAATSVFASGGSTPAVTATGTQVWNSPNPTVQFIDSIRSANNKNAYVQWGSTVFAIGFANDAFTGATNAFTITGGQASGISGITSTSGTGAWAHTGGFSASGGIDNTVIGAVTPLAGSFTTVSSSGGITTTTAAGVINASAGGTITPNQTRGIVGTTTNNNAQSGSWGEYQTNATTGTSLTTATPANATSITSLPAGDWDVYGTVTFVPAGTTTVTTIEAAISSTSATIPAGNTGAFNLLQMQANVFATGQVQTLSVGPVRVSQASAATIFLVAQLVFGVSTATCNGFIRARRVR